MHLNIKNYFSIKCFFQEEGYGLIVSEFEAIDINTELDFLTATVYAKENFMKHIKAIHFAVIPNSNNNAGG